MNVSVNGSIPRMLKLRFDSAHFSNAGVLFGNIVKRGKRCKVRIITVGMTS